VTADVFGDLFVQSLEAVLVHIGWIARRRRGNVLSADRAGGPLTPGQKAKGLEASSDADIPHRQAIEPCFRKQPKQMCFAEKGKVSLAQQRQSIHARVSDFARGTLNRPHVRFPVRGDQPKVPSSFQDPVCFQHVLPGMGDMLQKVLLNYEIEVTVRETGFL